MLKKYGFVRVGAVVPEIKVADTEFNSNEIIKQIEIAQNNKIQILCFPELSITGYSCGDLFHQDVLLENSIKALENIIEATSKLNIIIVIGMPIRIENQLFNTAVVIQNGDILGVVPKSYIPNYEEFYEDRWFTSGKDFVQRNIKLLGKEVPFGTDLLFKDKENNEICFAIEICEDLWVVNPPSSNYALNGANIIFNLSASNSVLGKSDYRKDLVKMQSAKTITGYIYVSAGVNESTTDMLFSGQAMVYENGTLLKENREFNFESNMIFIEIDTKRLMNDRQKNISYMHSKDENKTYRNIEINISDDIETLSREYSKTPFVPTDDKKKIKVCNEILNIQSYALAKRIKSIPTKKIIVGISGGLDSCLAFLVAIKAYEILDLDRKDIIAITMPGFGTTDKTLQNAKRLIEEYETTFREIDIKKACEVHFEDINQNKETFDITYENAQARERTQILMDIANKEGGIVLGTGDLSELALGWCTYNGDHMSMYGVNCGIPKTLVKYLIKYIADVESNESIKNILYSILETPISPELLPSNNSEILQLTEKEVGPYLLNDFFLYHFFRYGATPEKILFVAREIFKDEYSEEEIKEKLKQFVKRFFTQQFKRNCVPDGPKVGTVSLSPRGDLRMPSDASYNLWLKNLDNNENVN